MFTKKKENIVRGEKEGFIILQNTSTWLTILKKAYKCYKKKE